MGDMMGIIDKSRKRFLRHGTEKPGRIFFHRYDGRWLKSQARDLAFAQQMHRIIVKRFKYDRRYNLNRCYFYLMRNFMLGKFS